MINCNNNKLCCGLFTRQEIVTIHNESGVRLTDSTFEYSITGHLSFQFNTIKAGDKRNRAFVSEKYR